MIKTFQVILDLEKDLYSLPYNLFSISENDLDSVELQFQINQDDIRADLTGMTVEMAIKKPSGLTVYQECEITNAVQGEAVVRMALQSYSEYGTYTAELYIRSGEQLAVTCPFYYLSREAVMNDDTLESTNDWSAFLQALFYYDKKPILVDGIPDFAPEYIGQMAFDTTGKRAFISNDLAVDSWQLIGSSEGGGGLVAWADILGKPLLFPPEDHLHEIADVTGLQGALDGKANVDDIGGGAVDWIDVLNKPTTFAPSAHFHLWADITDKPTAFTPTTHTHAWTEITAKPTTFAPSAHSHAVADVTGLQGALDAKADDTDLAGKSDVGHTHDFGAITGKPATYPATAHTHDWATGITGKPTTFAPSAHTHPWTEVTGKPTTFAPSAHFHLWADITDKPTTFAPSAHVHEIADVTGLSTVLNGKVDDGEVYLKADVYNKTETYNKTEVDNKIEGVTTGGGTIIDDDLTSTNSTHALSANQGRILNENKADIAHTHLWADITDKPTTFTPSAHTHGIVDVTGLQGALDAKADDTDLDGKSDVGHTHAWTEITAKPTTFAPSAHTHLWADITDKPTTFAPTAHTHLWADLTDKPTTFAPSAHSHAIADVTGLQGALDGKADDADLDGKSDVGHTHAWTEITAKPTTFTPSAHTHLWADITDKPTTFTPATHTHDWATGVTGKPTTFAPSAHTHLWADITDKPTTFIPRLMSGVDVGGAQVGNGLAMSGNYLFVKTLSADGTKIDTVNNAIAIDRGTVDTWYAPFTHTHAWADVTGKPTTFAPSAHTHLWADITDKPTTFTPATHTHAIADVTDLQTALNGKADVARLGGLTLWSGTQAAYDALTKDANTLYFIT